MSGALVVPAHYIQATPAQMEMTLNVMAHSLVYWVQDALARGLLVRGSRVVAMTSAGSTRVWPGAAAMRSRGACAWSPSDRTNG